jgi:hypothetical protein
VRHRPECHAGAVSSGWRPAMTCTTANSTDPELHRQTMNDGTADNVGGLRRIAFAAMTLASFALYAAGVLALHQDRTSGWDNERSAMAAAVSYLKYGTHFGAVAINVEHYFTQPPPVDSRGRHIFANSAEEALAATADGSVPPGDVRAFIIDGSGAGLTLLVTIAMALFGPHTSSLVIFYLAVIGVSTLAFMSRYRDERQFCVLLYFLIASVMLLTPLSTSQAMADEAPIGGYRLFTLAAILPALHLYCEIVASPDVGRARPGIPHLLLLFVQGVVFFAILVERSSAGYLVLVLAIALCWRVYRDKIKINLRSPLVYKTASWALGLLLWMVIISVAMPQYVKSGRASSGFWRHAFVGLSFHPQWPFGNLSDVYECKKYIPTGLTTRGADANAHCVWVAYLLNKNHDISGVADGVFGDEYEKAVREAYFYVATHYPKQVFEVYAFTKSAMIGNVLANAWASLFHLGSAPVADSLFAVVAAQGALFIAFIVAAMASGRKAIDRGMLFFPLAFAASLLPLYVAWAGLWTSGDTILLMYCCVALVPALFLQWAASFIFAGRTRAAAHPKETITADALEPRRVSR